MSRLHNADSAIKNGREFVAALSDAGCCVSRSLVSRWESGEIAISYEGMSAYESALGVEPGQISSVIGYARAAMPGSASKVIGPQLDGTSREFAERLDELIRLAEDGRADARQWQELGRHLTCVPLVHLPGSTWESLSHCLLYTSPSP